MDKDKMDKVKISRRQWIVIATVAGVIISGMSFPACSRKAERPGTGMSQEKKIKHWTCSMHPQIKLPKPGKCPICGMDLIPLYEGISDSDEGGTVSLTLNEVGRRLAEVETMEVQFREVSHDLRLVGKVDYDETRLSYISAWVPGRIDRLYVDFTGTRVRKGDHLIKLYSPELLATQEEYLQAIKNLKETKDSQLSVIRNTARTTLTSAREKLRLYGIDQKQIEAIVKRGTPNEHMTITSPVTGTVIHKNGFEGMYVKTGDKIYTIADLSRVWLFLDAYESDIQWLHYGQNVTVETESYPGEIFHGKIAFIDPFVNEKTRTIKLRVNIDNKRERLKPGMFVRAVVKSVIGQGGKIYEEALAGKWICPMHPDVVRDQKGTCDICGMNLIRTSEFGFIDKSTIQKKVLVIPKTAPLITGKRAIVYVENPTKKTSIRRYEGREIVLGPRAGDYYIVLSGLKEGEMVVTKGNFKIDSALQIQAKPSMMNPAGYYTEGDSVLTQGVGRGERPFAPTEDAGILVSALPYYLSASKALAQDNAKEAAHHLKKFKTEIDKILKKGSLEEMDEGITKEVKLLREKMNIIKDDVDSLRLILAGVSGVLKDIFKKYSYTEDLKLYLSFCPMALGKGAWWFQDSRDIKNPYYGADMLECGEVKAEYGRKIIKQQPKGSHHNH